VKLKKSTKEILGGSLLLVGMIMVILSVPEALTVAGIPLALLSDVVGFVLIAIAILVFGTKNPIGGVSP
jgi:hypothetical protein